MVYIQKNTIYKKCKYCKKKFKIRSAHQLFCSSDCFKNHRKEYHQSPEAKKGAKEYALTPARKVRRRENAALPKNKKKRAEYRKTHNQLPYVR